MTKRLLSLVKPSDTPYGSDAAAAVNDELGEASWVHDGLIIDLM